MSVVSQKLKPANFCHSAICSSQRSGSVADHASQSAGSGSSISYFEATKVKPGLRPRRRLQNRWNRGSQVEPVMANVAPSIPDHAQC